MLRLSALERDIVARYHAKYVERGFPAPDAIAVTSRENTGAGRFTSMAHAGHVDLPDGPIDLGRYMQFDMIGLPAGASYFLFVENGQVSQLEIAVNGDDPWDGSENDWVIRNPDTGDLPDGS